jgi:hypothetical protein
MTKRHYWNRREAGPVAGAGTAAGPGGATA